MAKRPVFIPVCKREHLVDEMLVDFPWNSGFAPTQKKKNVIALHESAGKMGLSPLLEVSTKSEETLGRRLSVFSLKLELNGRKICLESAYQGSKVFEKGGPYIDIYGKSGKEAKGDPRVRESGDLVGFDFLGWEWPLNPTSAFYSWLYLSALKPHTQYLKRLYHYKGFTDIEFNPQKSISTQAYSCALMVSLLKLDLFDDALQSQSNFIKAISTGSTQKSSAHESHQERLALPVSNQ